LFQYFFLLCSLIGFSQPKIDSLIQVYNKNKDTNAVNAAINLCIEYSANDNKKAIEFGKKAFLLAEKINFEFGIANASKELAISYYYLSMSDSAEYYLEIAHKIFKKLERKRQLADVLVLEGIIFDYKALKNKSMQKYLEAIEIYEQIDDLRGLSVAYSNIALVYHRQNDLERALQYQLKSLEIAKKLKSDYSICVSMMNIGLIYEDKNQIDKALEYYLNAERIVREIGNKQFEAVLYNNIGLCYFKQKNYKKAMMFYKNSLEIKQQLQNKSSIATTLYNIARIHFEQNNFDSTKYYLDKCINLALECGDLKNLSNSYELNYQNYKKNNDFEKAVLYLEKYKQTDDSLNKITNDEKLNELQVLYNSAEDAKTIQKLNLENSNQILKNQNQRIIILSVALFLLLAIVGGIFIFFAYRNKLKLNNLLKEQNHEIEAQKRTLEEKSVILENQKKQLSELDEIKTRFFTNISHEFRTPLTLIISPMKSLIEKDDYPKIRKELEIVKRNAIRLLNLINELLYLSKLDQKSMKLKLVEADISEFIRKYNKCF
jgi:tetratricopeptide (TPR) repeat protein